MYKLYFLIFCLFFSGVGFAQCKNSVSIKKVARDTDASKGSIDVSVIAEGGFICALIIERGSGPQKVAEKRGQGNSNVHFEKLDTDEIYQVQVEFLTEDKSFCKKLTKSLITFEIE
jgi:hypothetical protein